VTTPYTEARIALLPGDGIGPEVVSEAVCVLRAVARRAGTTLDFVEELIGGAAIDECGDPLPPATVAACRSAQAVLLGAVGGPKWDNPAAPVRPEQGLLKLRKELGVFANLRPVRPHPALSAQAPVRAELLSGVDILVVRELTGGLYFGPRTREPHPSGEQVCDTLVYTTGEIERIVRLAARMARARRGRLTSVDKANVLESSRLWRATAKRVVETEFPDVRLDHQLVDSTAMALVRRPADFDVIVTENMFGDILSDEAGVLVGSLGLLPSASLGGDGPGLYEPIHGSAPDIAGRGIANPIGTILSTAMLCRESLGWTAAATWIEAAVARVLDEGARTADIAAPGQAALSTTEMGTRVAEVAARIDLPAAAEVP
jgi:3-isopropylmalate dehydrogenase